MKAIKSYFTGDYRMRLLVGTLIALVASDGIISRFLVTKGFGLEGNPFLKTWVHDENFLIIKLIGALLAGLILWDMYRQNPKLSFITTLCFVILYTVIVFWNLASFVATQVIVFSLSSPSLS